MKITIEHFDGKYPSFNVSLASGEGKQPFITIKGCKIIEGSKGPFVSWPARKQDDGKYWNHVYASDGFMAAVIEEARKTKPAPDPRTHAERKRPRDDTDDIPF